MTQTINKLGYRWFPSPYTRGCASPRTPGHAALYSGGTYRDQLLGGAR